MHADRPSDHTERRLRRAYATIAVLGTALLMAAGAASGHTIASSGGADLAGARAQGNSAGQRDGARRGTQRGLLAGRRQGRATAYRASFTATARRARRVELRQARRVALRKARRAAAAKRAAQAARPTPSPPAGSTYTAELPNGRPGYALPEDQSSLSCVGVDAQTGQCVGD
jgi:hypothetical protein